MNRRASHCWKPTILQDADSMQNVMRQRLVRILANVVNTLYYQTIVKTHWFLIFHTFPTGFWRVSCFHGRISIYQLDESQHHLVVQLVASDPDSNHL